MKFSRPSYRPLPIEVERAHNHKQLVMGYVLGAIGSALFSTKAIFIKLAYGSSPQLDTMTLLAIRMGMALPFYIEIAFWALRMRPTPLRASLTVRHYFGAASMGLIGYYLAAYLDFSGLLYITAQLERLILFTYPAFVMVLGALFFGKRIKSSGILSMVLAYTGLVLIFMRGTIASGENVWLGAMLVFAAAFSFAVFQLIASRQIKIFGSALFTCMAMICAGLGILFHYIIESIMRGGFQRLDQPKEVWILGACIAIIATIIPSFLVNIALGRIGAQAVAVVGMISPLATILLAVSFLGEPFGVIDGLGTLVTIIGIGLFTWFDRSSNKA